MALTGQLHTGTGGTRMGDLDDIVKDFLIESYENLDQLDRNLVALEKDPTAKDVLASIFRTIHTSKGTCGFLGFGKLEAVAHVGENLLSRMRDGELLLNPEFRRVRLRTTCLRCGLEWCAGRTLRLAMQT